MNPWIPLLKKGKGGLANEERHWAQKKKQAHSLAKSSFISHLDRLKYFDLCLSQQEEEQEYSDEWTPVIDMKEFRDACFQGKVKRAHVDITRGKGLRAIANSCLRYT